MLQKVSSSSLHYCKCINRTKGSTNAYYRDSCDVENDAVADLSDIESAICGMSLKVR